ncbi:hypothetical protein R69746_08706 [Paraburkholderia aspalathi]|nr:hypothetical protein R69746_08706 [Paraburkholderia aspalathi]
MRQDRPRGVVDGFERGTFTAFASHHVRSEVFCILLDGGQLGQGLVAHEQALQRGFHVIGRPGFDQSGQAQSFFTQCGTDDRLEGGVSGPHDALLIEPRNKFGNNEGRRHVAPHELLRFRRQ